MAFQDHGNITIDVVPPAIHGVLLRRCGFVQPSRLASNSTTPEKLFLTAIVRVYRVLHCVTARFLLGISGMTILPRDSDVVGAAVLLAIVLLTGIRALL